MASLLRHHQQLLLLLHQWLLLLLQAVDAGVLLGCCWFSRWSTPAIILFPFWGVTRGHSRQNETGIIAWGCLGSHRQVRQQQGGRTG
jgi:hypothetical protein